MNYLVWGSIQPRLVSAKDVLLRLSTLATLWVLLLVAVVSSCLYARFSYAQDLPETSRPNIVFFLSDDVGWGDTRVNNPDSKIPMPNLERLAQQGMNFTDAHTSAAKCAPTRYSALSGNYHWRGKLPWGHWLWYGGIQFLPGQQSIAQVLKSAGYDTAMIGKMHLGGDFYKKGTDEFVRYSTPIDEIDIARGMMNGPRTYGFDYTFTAPRGIQGAPYAFFENDILVGDPSLLMEWQAGQYGRSVIPTAGIGMPYYDSSEVGGTVLGKALEFLDQHHTDNQNNGTDTPFFMFYSATAAHDPFTPPAELDGQQIDGATNTNARLDMVYELDVALGALVRSLEERGLDDNTLIIFTSDNGGIARQVDRDLGHHMGGGLRGRKGTIWEGGHRVPFVAKWGDGTTAGSVIEPGSVSTQLIGVHDLMATIAALVEQPLADDQARDSFNILPVFTGTQDENNPIRDHIIMEADVVNNVEGPRQFAYREGDWKLIFSDTGEPLHLFNLSLDIGENNDAIDQLQNANLLQGMVDRFTRLYAADRTAPTENTDPPSSVISANNITVGEDVGSAIVTITLDPASTATVSVDVTTVDETASAGSDYGNVSETVAFAPGEVSKSVSIAIIDDSDSEPNETFSVALSNPQSAILATPLITATILASDTTQHQCGKPDVIPGGPEPTIALWLDCASDTWSLQMSDGLSTGSEAGTYTGTLSSTPATDFVSVNTLSFEGKDNVNGVKNNGPIAPAPVLNFVSRMMAHRTDTIRFEPAPDTSVCLDFSEASASQVVVGSSNLRVDFPFDIKTLEPCEITSTQIWINNLIVDEGAGIASVTVQLSEPTTSNITAQVYTGDGSATPIQDYIPLSSTPITIPAGDTQTTVTIAINDDDTIEPDETFNVTLFNVVGTGIADASAVVRIRDNDELQEQRLSIDDVVVNEDIGIANATVRLSGALTTEVTANISTRDGTATAGDDYIALTNTRISIPAGETQVSVPIIINDDDNAEPAETFTITASNITGAEPGDTSAVVTVSANDNLPRTTCGRPSFITGGPAPVAALWQDCNSGRWTLQLTDDATDVASVYEGYLASSPANNFSFASSISFEGPDRLNGVSNDGVIPAAPTLDFTAYMIRTGTDQITFTPAAATSVCLGFSSAPVTQVLVGASNTLVDVPFNINTLTPCDTPRPVVLSIDDLTVIENTNIARVTLRLSDVATSDVTVDVTSTDNTAIAPGDYPLVALRATIPAGQLQTTIPVAIIDDADAEPSESFILSLNNATGAVITDGTAVVTITDDDTISNVQCGKPNYTPGDLQPVVALWENCTTGIWHLEMTDGTYDDAASAYFGSLTASPDVDFEAVSTESFEGLDEVNGVRDNNTIPLASSLEFVSRMIGAGTDTILFKPADGTDTCLSFRESPVSSVLVGAGNTQVNLPFNINTFDSCQ